LSDSNAEGLPVGTVWVVGSINLDLIVSTTRLPGPGETVHAHSLDRVPGGKGANQAVAAARLGAPTRMIGRVGDDEAGDVLRSFLAAMAVDVTGVSVEPGPSGTAIVVVDALGQNSILVVSGANGALDETDLDALAVGAGDVVVVQNEVPPAVSSIALSRARAVGATSIVNPAPATEGLGAMVRDADVVVLNALELATLSGHRVDERTTTSDLVAAASAIRHADHDTGVVTTLGARGVVAVFGDGRVLEAPAAPAQVVDTTGAGDAFVGAVACALARGDGLVDGIELALVASSIVVGRWGAGPAMPTEAEVASLTNRARRI
jgi:ribokinase